MNHNSIFFIAEAGINHNGELSTAFKLIELAKHAGCDSIKFQKRDLDVCIPENQKYLIRQTPWGEITYLDYKKKMEFGKSEYDEINSYCKKLKIDWSASAWDVNSLHFIEGYDPSYHKIPSAMNTNLELIKEAAQIGRKTIVSTGMCEIKDVDRVVEIFDKFGTELILLHTISTYPAKEEELNLSMISVLKKRYGLEIGYSGHESSVSPSIVAAALGATVIERHITLDRSMWGTDHSASLERPGLEMLVGSLRKIPSIIGNGIKTYSVEEKQVAAKMRYWE